MDIKVDKTTVVGFDLDDTLYNEIDFLRSAFLEIAKNLHHDWHDLYENMLLNYHSGLDVFQKLSQQFRKTTKKELITTYRSHNPEIVPFAGVKKLFADIKKRKGRISVVTDGRSLTQRNKLKALGLIDHLDYLVISEEIGTEKPNKNNFISVEESLKASRYFYIGDNYSKDFLWPNKLGWTTIALEDNGKNIHKIIKEHLRETDYFPSAVIRKMADLKVG